MLASRHSDPNERFVEEGCPYGKLQFFHVKGIIPCS